MTINEYIERKGWDIINDSPSDYIECELCGEGGMFYNFLQCEFCGAYTCSEHVGKCHCGG